MRSLVINRALFPVMWVWSSLEACILQTNKKEPAKKGWVSQDLSTDWRHLWFTKFTHKHHRRNSKINISCSHTHLRHLKIQLQYKLDNLFHPQGLHWQYRNRLPPTWCCCWCCCCSWRFWLEKQQHLPIQMAQRQQKKRWSKVDKYKYRRATVELLLPSFCFCNRYRFKTTTITERMWCDVMWEESGFFSLLCVCEKSDHRLFDKMQKLKNTVLPPSNIKFQFGAKIT